MLNLACPKCGGKSHVIEMLGERKYKIECDSCNKVFILDAIQEERVNEKKEKRERERASETFLLLNVIPLTVA